MEIKLLNKIEKYLKANGYTNAIDGYEKIIGNHRHVIKITDKTTPKFFNNTISLYSYYRKSNNSNYRSYTVIAAKFKNIDDFIFFKDILVNSCL